MDYKNEEEFLKNYNSNDFEKLSLTSDILIFSVSDEENNNYRKLSKKHFSILLVKRDNYPFKNKWCLPGGFVDINESIDDAAIRILSRETNLHDIYIEQLFTFGSVKRDPRMRIVSTSYMTLIDKNKIKDKLIKNASWFNISYNDDTNDIKVNLDNGNEQINFIIGKNKKNNNDGFDLFIKEDNSLAFDHSLVIATGIIRLKNKINYTSLVFNMMPVEFTIGELQQVYESILGKELLSPAFRRIIANKIESTGKFKTGAGHRPSELYKFIGKHQNELE